MPLNFPAEEVKIQLDLPTVPMQLKNLPTLQNDYQSPYLPMESIQLDLPTDPLQLNLPTEPMQLNLPAFVTKEPGRKLLEQFCIGRRQCWSSLHVEGVGCHLMQGKC